MPRNLQHIGDSIEMDDAIHNGEKVTALCGKRHYPLAGMGDHIPTCTRCSRALMAEVDALASELAQAKSQLEARSGTRWVWSR